MADGGRVVGSSQALVSVAMLKISLDQEGRDYIDQLSSFVKECFPEIGGVIDIDQLALDVKSKFGLRVPTPVIESSLRRIAKKGVISRQNATYVVAKPARDNGFSSRRQQAAGTIAIVVDSFQKFYCGNFEGEINEAQAQDAFVSFVSQNSIECLRSFVYRTPFPKIVHNTQLSYAVARFINNAHEHDSELFKRVLVVFQGVMLANSFMCPDLDSMVKKFSGVSFYLDTPIILSILGLHGTADSRKLKDLVELLRDLRGGVFVFEHSLDEVDAVLGWCEGAIQRGEASGRVVRNLLAEGKGLSDLIILRAQVRERLSEVGVSTSPSPPYIESLQIDERALEGILVQGVGYPRERAIHYDINSVRSIYALRNGTRPLRLEDAKAVFVTSNSSFARAAFAYSRKYDFAKKVSPVITDYVAVNIAWLKSPMRAADLPKHELLAMCFAALEPGGEVWNSFLQAAERLRKDGVISADELAILRSDGGVRQDMMDLTVGADEDFKVQDVQLVLERLKERLTAEKDREMIAVRQAGDESLRRIDTLSGENSKIISQARAVADRKMALAERNARAFIYSVWALVAAATLALPFAVPGKGTSFWVPFACLIGMTVGPLVVSLFKLNIISQASHYWGRRKRRQWVEENSPFLVGEDEAAAGV